LTNAGRAEILFWNSGGEEEKIPLEALKTGCGDLFQSRRRRRIP